MNKQKAKKILGYRILQNGDLLGQDVAYMHSKPECLLSGSYPADMLLAIGWWMKYTQSKTSTGD